MGTSSHLLSLISTIREETDEGLFGFGQWNTSPVKLLLKDENCTPYTVHTARKVPLPIMSAVRETLQTMEKEKIIKKVTSPTPWVSPMVPVAKKGSKKVRITVDYRKLNKNLMREIFPMLILVRIFKICTLHIRRDPVASSVIHKKMQKNRK